MEVITNYPRSPGGGHQKPLNGDTKIKKGWKERKKKKKKTRKVGEREKGECLDRGKSKATKCNSEHQLKTVSSTE